MRVISGSRKGTILQAVPGKRTRPTVDKVKESIFNMIGPYFNGGIALDLYAGSGGLGIEALSRGMEKAVFVDIDRKAIEVIRANLVKTDLSDRSEVYKNDAARALRALSKRDLLFDLVLLDPPYERLEIEKQIELLERYELLRSDAVLVAETDAKTILPDSIGQIVKQREAEYGSSRVTIFGKLD